MIDFNTSFLETEVACVNVNWITLCKLEAVFLQAVSLKASIKLVMRAHILHGSFPEAKGMRRFGGIDQTPQAVVDLGALCR